MVGGFCFVFECYFDQVYVVGGVGGIDYDDQVGVCGDFFDSDLMVLCCVVDVVGWWVVQFGEVGLELVDGFYGFVD